MRPLLRLLLAATVSVAACGGSSSGDGTAPITTGVAGSSSTTTTVPGSTIAPEARGLPGLSAELATLRIENGGRLPADAALDLFAAGFGDVPDADSARFEFR